MKKYRLKKKFLVVFYILVMVSFIGAIFAVDVYLKEDNKKNPEIKYINKNVIDNDIPVINVESTTIGIQINYSSRFINPNGEILPCTLTFTNFRYEKL